MAETCTFRKVGLPKCPAKVSAMCFAGRSWRGGDSNEGQWEGGKTIVGFLACEGSGRIYEIIEEGCRGEEVMEVRYLGQYGKKIMSICSMSHNNVLFATSDEIVSFDTTGKPPAEEKSGLSSLIGKKKKSNAQSNSESRGHFNVLIAASTGSLKDVRHFFCVNAHGAMMMIVVSGRDGVSLYRNMKQSSGGGQGNAITEEILAYESICVRQGEVDNPCIYTIVSTADKFVRIFLNGTSRFDIEIPEEATTLTAIAKSQSHEVETEMMILYGTKSGALGGLFVDNKMSRRVFFLKDEGTGLSSRRGVCAIEHVWERGGEEGEDASLGVYVAREDSSVEVYSAGWGMTPFLKYIEYFKAPVCFLARKEHSDVKVLCVCISGAFYELKPAVMDELGLEMDSHDEEPIAQGANEQSEKELQDLREQMSNLDLELQALQKSVSRKEKRKRQLLMQKDKREEQPMASLKEVISKPSNNCPLSLDFDKVNEKFILTHSCSSLECVPEVMSICSGDTFFLDPEYNGSKFAKAFNAVNSNLTNNATRIAFSPDSKEFSISIYPVEGSKGYMSVQCGYSSGHAIVKEFHIPPLCLHSLCPSFPASIEMDNILRIGGTLSPPEIASLIDECFNFDSDFSGATFRERGEANFECHARRSSLKCVQNGNALLFMSDCPSPIFILKEYISQRAIDRNLTIKIECDINPLSAYPFYKRMEQKYHELQRSQAKHLMDVECRRLSSYARELYMIYCSEGNTKVKRAALKQLSGFEKGAGKLYFHKENLLQR
eukprot:Nk52_evm99s2192 gene=Nk52_evmTU99s2192